MKPVLPVVLLLLMGLSACAPSPGPSKPPTLRVMTFNIRYNTAADSAHAWPYRRDWVASTVRFHEADLLGIQEALPDQVSDLAERLPDFEWIGVGRDDGASGGEFSAIFYRRARFVVEDHGTFWLSETPEVPGSKSWDAAITRIVTWARFRDGDDGPVFYHFNTHFDHVGEQAREESARLIVDRVNAMAGTTPTVITGDFNADPTRPPYAVLSAAFRDAFSDSGTPHHGPDATYYGGFVINAASAGRRIDYIFVNNDVTVLRHGTLTDNWFGNLPSDHLPVLAEIVLGPAGSTP
jgi:endonuclease/exonuclease/phosphatase family metal-dependent hydrolase